MTILYLTADLPGVGGRIKVQPEDFFVEELPLYPTTGQGQHVYAVIEKRGLSTYAAINALARALHISPAEVGHAGLKDAQAVTRQTLSFNLVSPEAVQALDLPQIKILAAERHPHKLKTGHLAGNRFVIRTREVAETALPAAQAIIERLARQGIPNFFGTQRFGVRGNTGRLGELLIRQDALTFVAEFLGRPQPVESLHIQAARQLIDHGQLSEALAHWPSNLADERRVLAALIKANGQPEAALPALNPKLKSLFVSAFQSELFNRLLAVRLERLEQLEVGDIAYIHGKGASFLVQEAQVEQPRADRFEISPSGPLFGPKLLQAEGQPGEQERSLLAEYNLSLADFKVAGMKIRGARRPYRIQLKNPQVRWDDGLLLSFELEPGAYATTVLAEVMK